MIRAIIIVVIEDGKHRKAIIRRGEYYDHLTGTVQPRFFTRIGNWWAAAGTVSEVIDKLIQAYSRR